MKKFLVFIVTFCTLLSGVFTSVWASVDEINNTNIIFSKTSAMAQPAAVKKNQPLMYPNPRNGYRTGYARPKTRFARPNKRFSKPQTRFAHKRPEYIYTKEYQRNIVNRHRPGMMSNKKNTNLVVANNKTSDRINNSKVIACGGITYYGIQNNCK